MSAIAVVEVDAGLKAEAEQIFAQSGHSVAEAVRILLKRTVDERSIPVDLFGTEEEFICRCFEPGYVVHPNAETIEAMRELEAGGGKRANSVEELMADLRADD